MSFPISRFIGAMGSFSIKRIAAISLK